MSIRKITNNTEEAGQLWITNKVEPVQKAGDQL